MLLQWRALLDALEGLGPKPKKVDGRRRVKAFVVDVNAADAAAGHVIETEEREDLCCALEEVLHAVKHPALVDEVDAWRDG